MIIGRSKELTDRLIKSRGNDRPPFSPNEFAGLLGISEIVKADLGTLGAMILRTSGGYVIKINELHPVSRQNFSFAHELGHILLDELCIGNKLQPMEFRNFNPPAHLKAYARAKERLCDIAAAELLMPETIYKKYLSALGTSIDTIEKLANLFKVSLQTSAIRVSELSDEPCIAIMWNLKHKSQFENNLYVMEEGTWNGKNRRQSLRTPDYKSRLSIFFAFSLSKRKACKMLQNIQNQGRK